MFPDKCWKHQHQKKKKKKKKKKKEKTDSRRLGGQPQLIAEEVYPGKSSSGHIRNAGKFANLENQSGERFWGGVGGSTKGEQFRVVGTNAMFVHAEGFDHCFKMGTNRTVLLKKYPVVLGIREANRGSGMNTRRLLGRGELQGRTRASDVRDVPPSELKKGEEHLGGSMTPAPSTWPITFDREGVDQEEGSRGSPLGSGKRGGGKLQARRKGCAIGKRAGELKMSGGGRSCRSMSAGGIAHMSGKKRVEGARTGRVVGRVEEGGRKFQRAIRKKAETGTGLQ